jgi:hypothetical protein
MIHNVIDSLIPLCVDIDTVNIDQHNLRIGHDIDRLALSLERYGQRKPIVVNIREDNRIIAGNGTWNAAKSLGWAQIAAVFVDEDESSATEYAIADNRLAELSEWDIPELFTALAEIEVENDDLGFDADMLKNMKFSVTAEAYDPDLMPDIDASAYSHDDVERAKEALRTEFKDRIAAKAEFDTTEMICPHCSEVFYVKL